MRSRGARPACLTTRPGGGEPGQVAGLGQDRRGPDRGQPVDGGDQRRSGRARRGRRPSGPRCRPAWRWASSQSARIQLDPLERRRPVREHPGRVGQRGEQACGRSAGTARPAPAGDLARAPPARTGPARAGGCGPGPRRHGRTTTVIAATQVGDRNGCFAVVQRGRPHALEQVADLLHAARRARSSSCSRRAPRCRSRPHGLIDRLGQVAAQLRGQPGDQHRVLVVGLVDGQVLGSAAPTTSAPAARTRTTSPGPRRAGPAPATGARSAHTPPSPRRTLPRRPGRRPSPTRRRDPTPCTGTSAAPAPSSRGRSPRPSACDRPGRSRRSRSSTGTSRPQPRQPRVAVPIPTGHTTTVGHERPPSCDGTPSPTSASGGRSHARPDRAERLSMPQNRWPTPELGTEPTT